MAMPWNTQGISVTKSSWLPGWQFSVWHANGIDMGGAPTEDEAWKKARTIARFHGIPPVA